MKRLLITLAAGLFAVTTAQAQQASAPDYSGAAAGIGSLISVGMILIFLYSVLCFLVPIFIYRIMRRGTQVHDTLLRIEQLQRGNISPPVKSPEPEWDRTKIYGQPAVQDQPDLASRLSGKLFKD